MSSINGINIAREGLARAEEKMAKAAERISQGDISAEALVDAKVSELDVKTQAHNLKNMTELEDELLDILA